MYSFAMQTNQGWIRDLFRYSLASLSSISIIVYLIISSIATLFFPNKNTDRINDIFLSSENAHILLSWASTIWYIWDVKNNNFIGIKRGINAENNISKNTSIITSNRLKYDTNQFLQNGINLQWNNHELLYEHPEWDKFDIEKIIAELNLQKEKKVAVIAKELGVNRKEEKWEYAKLAWIEWKYNWSLEQNQKIRSYLIANAQEIYKDKHWRNERETLPLVAIKENTITKMNSKEIKWELTYNNVTLKVSAPTESFPEWSILKIKTLEDDDFMTKLDITLWEVALLTQVNSVKYDAPMVSFDISFYAPEDTDFTEELQPAEWKYISVTFDYASNTEFTDSKNDWFLAIYHIEDHEDMSIANLAGIENFQNTKNNKSDSIDIYANTLSVYILTIVSDLDEDASQNNNTITFDAGTGGFIVDDNIILSTEWLYSQCTTGNCIYTWKILSNNDSITLPNIYITWQTFLWWYSNNTFIWEAWSTLKLWNFSNTTEEQPTNNDEKLNNNYKFYACLYTEWAEWDICHFGENIDSNINDLDLNVKQDSLDNKSTTFNPDIYVPTNEEVQRFWEEVFVAYNWAIANWITTIDDINKAKLNTNITRAELAKMMVVFMSWVLQKEPVIIDTTTYKDVNSNKLWDLTWYIQLAYQYQIMWINADWSPMENFSPNKPVSRWEFATVLSRVLFGNTYNQNWLKYYEQHISALNNANILNNTDPNITEWRWWIMTMLYRSQL